ncbi:YsnF/AvaK domain-containing protein [uncultured Arthrobacter sp.]|uniref:YsnF/AvaK domain-containing protein n=1 Tax=uncultured Arthrobacter sp. TaxID=114050 RepID=UPI0026031C46|nr:YsnF/AvaK domain-containing protein [uncultured Arthrobacter sp.]
MISQNDIDTILSGRSTVLDSHGTKIGTAGQVYLDDQSGDPSWVTVKTGLFGTSESFVPLQGAHLTGNDVNVAYIKDQVKDAPRIESDGDLSPEEEQRLYRHYGLAGQSGQHDRTGDVLEDKTATTGGVGTGEAGYERGYQDGDERIDRSDDKGIVGHDTSGPTTDDAMTRSEEQLRVGTERRESGTARLRKYVVTENVSTTVPLKHEEIRVVSEPITDANRGDALDGLAISEEEHEVVLHEERAVVDKEAVAVERIRLDKETVTEQQEVTDEVRKEKIEVLDSTTDNTKNQH